MRAVYSRRKCREAAEERDGLGADQGSDLDGRHTCVRVRAADLLATAHKAVRPVSDEGVHAAIHVVRHLKEVPNASELLCDFVEGTGQ
jgi:hypothetical protein